MPITSVKEFLQKESAGGLLIIAAAMLAMLAENSPLKALYAPPMQSGAPE